ncbi:hypothetical protein ACN6K6_001137 [Streptomyces violaceoruber]|uniref:hypothetical protein n=1 Tax=Streptomyces TaxID=1883 RepID=UPI0015F25984|nr:MULTISPECIES: hypothetical protein [Streptomyces]MCW8122457.1 hypothetical protein [Streptomyces anthocyanicus]
MVQSLAAADELQPGLQRELTCGGLCAVEVNGCKGGRRPAMAATKAGHPAVTDLLTDHAAIEEAAPAPEAPVTVGIPGRVADQTLKTVRGVGVSSPRGERLTGTVTQGPAPM